MHATIEATRRQMVSQQVRTWDVLDPRTLEAMAAVPRERFVPEQFRDAAYADAPIPLGHGQHMLPPKTDGRILQALAINAGDTILDVGTGSGYLAACLAHRGGRRQGGGQDGCKSCQDKNEPACACHEEPH